MKFFFALVSVNIWNGEGFVIAWKWYISLYTSNLSWSLVLNKTIMFIYCLKEKRTVRDLDLVKIILVLTVGTCNMPMTFRIMGKCEKIIH